MNLNYDITTRCFRDSTGAVIYNHVPRIVYGEKPSWAISILDNKAAADLSSCQSWRAAIFRDFNSSTDPMARTVTGITRSENAVTIPLDTATTRFKEVCEGRQETNAWMEVAGLGSNSQTVVYLVFKIVCVFTGDPVAAGTVEPISVTNMTVAQVQAYAAAAGQSAAQPYATQAAASATSAASSATSAATSATTATTQAGLATTAKNDAVTAKESAESSASSASSSATTATTQAGLATTAKNDAVTAKESAESSASAASSSATTATNAATTATTAKNDAVTAKESAESSASSASSSATTASTAATNATTAKNDAVTAKESAESSASAASASATTASNAATTATTKASEATTAATSVSSSVSTATTKASEAAASATAAAGSATSAESAKTDCQTLKTDCQTIKTQTQQLQTDIIAVINVPVGHAYNVGASYSGGIARISFQDPLDNITDNGATIAHWYRTRCICKVGGYPANETDGTVVFDNTVRDTYKDTPYQYAVPEGTDIRFALFTQATNGTWNTSDTAPRFNFNLVSFATIRQLLRSGLPLSTINLSVGGVVDVQTSTRFPDLRWKLVDADYRGNTIQDSTVTTKRAIFIPQYLVCEAVLDTALMMQFDAPESQYAITDDTVFVSGKTYYKFVSGTYTALAENTDWTAGDSVATWTAANSLDVYSKNHDQRRSYGSNRWKESNIRQWLNATGTGWFQKQNIFDVKSSNAGYTTGFKSAFDSGFLSLIMPCYNTVAKNTFAVTSYGAGGASETTLDTFWLPSNMEIFGSANNGYQEGLQFDYFKNTATSSSSRIMVDEGGSARIVWLRSPYTGSASNEYCITASGTLNINGAGNQCALLPAMCIA